MNNYITPNLKKFAALTALYSVCFYYLLFAFHAHKIWIGITIAAAAYGILMFLTGMYFGKRDPIRKSRKDLDFMYHLATFVIVNSIGLIAVLLAKPTELLSYFYGTGFWGIGLLMHYISSRNSLKGMRGKDVF